MLHLFVGIDTKGAKARVRSEALKSKSELVIFGEAENTFDTVMSFLNSQALFSPSVALLLDRPLEDAAGKALLKEEAKALHAHTVPVYVIEVSLSTEDKKLFPKNTEAVDFGKRVTEERMMPFGFSDAVLRGDKKGAWIEYQKLLLQGASAEELHGTLSWAVRSALIAGKARSATEAGLKPFVYTKSKGIAEKQGIAQMEDLSRKLVAMYHQSRSGEFPMELGIEKLILEKN